MKARIVILVALAVCLLLGSVALRQAQGGALAQSSRPPSAQYVVTKGTASGGHYRLTSVSWQANGASSGGGYHLLILASPSGGNQCCCTYLPCVLRNY
jgi:hypothetical protein